jgi:hypothetical protein
VNDPAFLDTPELEGIAAYIVPLDIIGTDPERLLANNEEVQQAGATSFFGYPRPPARDRTAGRRTAPPLRGGPRDRATSHRRSTACGRRSVPAQRLGTERVGAAEAVRRKRHLARARASTPAVSTMPATSSWATTPISRAPTTREARLALRRRPVPGRERHNPMVSPYVNLRRRATRSAGPAREQILDRLYANVLLAWNIFFPPPLTHGQMEDRKIFNTQDVRAGQRGPRVQRRAERRRAARDHRVLKTL